MSFLGNLLWLILGGLVIALIYFIVGLLFCVSIIGIPFGLQLMKLGVLALSPFGKDIATNPSFNGCLSIFMNVLWFLIGGWNVALLHLGIGLVCLITIIGIPFALQHFKLALVAVFPFGSTMV
ncbi:MAG: YccF domain-containing protein [Candidatus Cryptobacteroides sp.]|nr:YccF domain-containing protein [Bacteroidales bacterium]